MPDSQQFSIIDFAISAFVVTGVAVMLAQMVLSNPIPWVEKKRLIDKYGAWAVNRAEAFCPHGDVACVEREAKWLIQVYRQRRGL